MTPADQMLIERACERSVLGFFAALDARDDPTVAAHMAPEGVWERGGIRLAGRDAVMIALAGRPERRITCHCVSNVRVDVRDGDQAVAQFYLIAYEGHAGESDFRVAAIRACSDSLVCIDGRWLIAVKQSRAYLPPQT